MIETDLQLLDRYSRHHAEDAFAEIVRRHLNLVFSAALRQVRSPQLAEEVAQSVFTDLARRVRDLAPGTTLAAWLYQVTRRTAIDVIRRESRRQLREQIACEINTMNASSADWTHIEPLLDEAMAALDEGDRTAILLRYFENQSLRGVGQALGTTDDAAQKRVGRAVERLREFFARRGVTVGAGGLAVAISANASQAAPVGLAATIATAALTGGILSTSTLITATKTIAMTTIQKTLVTGALAVALGAGLFEARQAAQWQQQAQKLGQQQAQWAEENRRLQGEHDAATNQLAAMQMENTRLKSNQNKAELLKLRGQVTQLQNESNDPASAAAKAWLEKVNKLKQRLEATPGAKIPELALLTDQDWLDATKDNNLGTDNDYRRAFSALRNAAEHKFVGTMLQPAVNSFSQANNGQFPTDLSQLQAYFAAPVDDAILQRWEVAPASTVPNVGVGDQVITEKSAVDEFLDSRTALGSRGYGSVGFLTSELSGTLQSVYQAYMQANGGSEPGPGFNIAQMLPYATTPEQQSAIQKMIQQQALRN